MFPGNTPSSPTSTTGIPPSISSSSLVPAPRQYARVPLRRALETTYQAMLHQSKTSTPTAPSPFGKLPPKFAKVYRSDVILHFVNSLLVYLIQLLEEQEKAATAALEATTAAGTTAAATAAAATTAADTAAATTAAAAIAGAAVTAAETTAMTSEAEGEGGEEEAAATRAPRAPRGSGVLPASHVSPPQSGRASPSTPAPPALAAATPVLDIAGAVDGGQLCREAMVKVSEGYSRLLLLCSNYDSTVCDVSFFESLYYFVTVCVKICLGLGMHGGGSAHSPSVVAVEREIGRLFRGGFWRASETKKTEEEMNYVEMRYKLEGREHPRDVAFKEVPVFDEKADALRKRRAKAKARVEKEEKERGLKLSSLQGSSSRKKRGSRGVSRVNRGTTYNNSTTGTNKEGNNEVVDQVHRPKFAPSLEADAPLEDHEERVASVIQRCEENLVAAAKLRKWVGGRERNGQLGREKRSFTGQGCSKAVEAIVSPRNETPRQEKLPDAVIKYVGSSGRKSSKKGGLIS